MKEASNAKSMKYKSTGGPTGPRTDAGKNKSKLNALTHCIFLQCVLDEERDIATVLFKAFKQYYGLKGMTELVLADRFVRSFLVDRRICKYERHQFKLAEIANLIDMHDQRPSHESEGFPAHASPREEALRGHRFILRLHVSLWALEQLYAKVEKDGPDYAPDVEILKALFGECGSISELTLMFTYGVLGKSLEEYQGDEKAIRAQSMKQRKPILEALKLAIRQLKIRIMCEMERLEVESEGGYKPFPPDTVLDFIERQWRANDRRRSRDLQELESMRRLRGQM